MKDRGIPLWLDSPMIELLTDANGSATGAVVGLVAITPGAGFVSPLAALLIGICGALVSFAMIQLRNALNFDDSLDVFACHGMAGVTGTLLLGVFSLKSVNPAGADGLPGADG